ELRYWLNTIRKNMGNISLDKRQSLADLGLEIANMMKSEGNGQAVNAKAAEALKDIEKALGVAGEQATADILIAGPRPAAPKEVPTAVAAFDTALMTFLLDGNNHKLKTKVRGLLSDPMFSYDRITPDKESYRDTILEWTQLLADQGFGALAYPENCGGSGDMSKYLAVFEILGHHDLSLAIKFGVQFGLWGGSVMGLGNKYHHKKYLKDIGKLTLPGCFAMTEQGHGSNVRDLETTATYDAETEEFVIHSPSESATKTYIGNAAAHGQMASVFAQLHTEDEGFGVHAFLVPIRNKKGEILEGVTITDNGYKLGLNGVDNGKISFDQVRVPRENLLSRFGEVNPKGKYTSSITSDSKRFFTMLGTLVGGRVAVPMAGLSATKSALTIAIKYACKRRQFGRPDQAETIIMDYRSHQKRIIPLLSKAYALSFAHQYVAGRYLNRTEKDAREVEALAAGLKSYSTWNATKTIQECREACGGQGYIAENRFASLKADTEIFTTFEGDNTVLMQLVAKGRLAEFAHEFRNMNLFGLVRYFSGQAGTYIAELNPLTIRNTSEEHLLDPEFHLAAFRYREAELVGTAARRLKKRVDAGMDSYDAFMECQNHLINLAHGYVERLILEQFSTVIEQCDRPDVKNMLQKLCTLFALTVIQEHKDWYLEHGYMDGSKTKAIRKAQEALCGEIRPQVLPLVDAFAIPNAILGAPIAS
ncbi:MAG: acyl-CoA dehydrogenase, partial [Chitinophagales bacterium]